jgi:hypothetical protein
MIAVLIRFLRANFTLTFLILGLIATTIALLRPPRRVRVFPAVQRGHELLYTFVVHVFFGDLAATFVGWTPSPFQAEVG